MTEFILKIEMGNAEMETHQDIVYALMKVIHDLNEGDDIGQIRDINGNKVGHFEIIE